MVVFELLAALLAIYLAALLTVGVFVALRYVLVGGRDE